MRRIAILLVVSALASPAFAQKSKGKKTVKAKATVVNTADWPTFTNQSWGFSVRAPKEWQAMNSHHDDPDGVGVAGSAVNMEGNAIEFNREATDQKNTPYVLVYAVTKQFEEFEENAAKLRTAIEQFRGNMLETRQILLNGMIGYEYTFEFPGVATVRTLALYKDGKRYGIMYTVNDDPTAKAFKRNLPYFEEVLKSFQVVSKPEGASNPADAGHVSPAAGSITDEVKTSKE